MLCLICAVAKFAKFAGFGAVHNADSLENVFDHACAEIAQWR